MTDYYNWGGGTDAPDAITNAKLNQTTTHFTERLNAETLKSLAENKGDILVATGEGAATILPAGTDGQILAYDSSEPTGLKAIDAPSGDGGGGALNWRGDWVTATAYDVDDAVQSGTRKSSYRCKTAHTSGATTQPGVGASWATYWQVIAQAGETGATGATGAAGADGTDGADGVDGLNGIVWESDWDNATAYTENDAVQHNGTSYVCILAHTGHEPPNGTYWDVVAAKGDTGADGTDGDAGWTPEFAVVSDGNRRVLQIADWTGGTGTKPGTGLYVGATGLEADVANGLDIRGATGTGTDAESIHGVAIDDTAPTTGQILVYNGTEIEWQDNDAETAADLYQFFNCY